MNRMPIRSSGRNDGTLPLSAKRHALMIIAAAALTILSYLNTLPNPFLWDDIALIANNRTIQDIKNVPFLLTPEYHNRHLELESFRPLRDLTFIIDYAVWQLNATGYHLTNLLLHTANTILVYWLTVFLWSRFRSPLEEQDQPVFQFLSAWVPFFTSALFATHPVHTEAITWIKNRSELLAFIFMQMAILLFFRGDEQTGKKRFPGLYFGAGCCFVLGLLSKETVIVLPILLMLIIFCFHPRADQKSAFRKVVPFWIIVFCYFLFKKNFLVQPPAGEMIPEISALTHLLLVIKTVFIYGKLLLAPIQLNVSHLLTLPETLFRPESLGLVLFAGAVPVSLLFCWRFSRILFFSAAWVFVTLLPAANIQVLWSRMIAEQRLYIPSFGFCLMLAYLAARLIGMKARYREKVWRIPGILVIAGLIAVYCSLTISRNRDWRDAVSLWTKAVQYEPGSNRAHINLGSALARKGSYEAAVKSFQNALRIAPDYPETRNKLAHAYLDCGDLAGAAEQFEYITRHWPDNSTAFNELGKIQVGQKKFEEGIGNYHRAIELRPDYAEAYNNLGVALARKEDYEQAIKSFVKAFTLVPDYAEAYNNIGYPLIRQGRFREAARYYEKALLIKPDYQDARSNLSAVRRIIVSEE